MLSDENDATKHGLKSQIFTFFQPSVNFFKEHLLVNDALC